jgi:hypothetical protein
MHNKNDVENFKVIRSCLAKKYANAYKSGL